MEFKQVTICTTTEGSDLVSCILLEAGSEGVSIKDPNDVMDLIHSDVIWDYIDENLLVSDKRVYVSGFFNRDFSVDGIISELENLRNNSEFDVGSLELTTSLIRSEDYENVWKQYYKPIEIGKVVIVPKWIKRKKDDHIEVLIDPGMAFGTGNHETTSMCIRLLDSLELNGKSVCDLGCGSGILGITALKLGASSCVMSDIDEQAIKAAKANAELNGVTGRATIIRGDLDADGKKFDVLIANITADVLIRLSGLIKDVLKSGGVVILSGIINARADEVIAAYRDFKVRTNIKDGEWQAFLLE